METLWSPWKGVPRSFAFVALVAVESCGSFIVLQEYRLLVPSIPMYTTPFTTFFLADTALNSLTQHLREM